MLKTPDELRAHAVQMREIATQYSGQIGAERILELAAKFEAKAAALESEVFFENPMN